MLFVGRLLLWFVFLNHFFEKNISGIPSECQTVWVQIRPDILSGLVWVQTVCKGYQQTTLVGKDAVQLLCNSIRIKKKSLERVSNIATGRYKTD